MLKTLQQLGSEEARSVLASVATSLLPTPMEPDASRRLSTIEAQAFDELRSTLRINAGDTSPQSRTLILEQLASLIQEYVLATEKPDVIRRRLGENGKLFPSQYEYSFSPHMQPSLADQALREHNVLEAARHPDLVQHLHKRLDQDLTLFTKRVGNQASEYILLLQAIRSGFKQTIDAIWRVYLSDVKVRDRAEPLDILKSFAEEFGMPFVLPGRPAEKFIDYASAVVTPGFNPHTYLTSVAFKQQPQHTYTGHFSARVSSASIAEFSLCYVIDVTNYLQYLRRKGVA